MNLMKDNHYGRRFYLVQRIEHRPYAPPKTEKASVLQSLSFNPFGYGRLGDYELDYMGAAEFEWGAIPEAGARLNESEIVIDRFDFRYPFKGSESHMHVIDLLYLEEDGDPIRDWEAWIKDGCYGKESAYDFITQLENGTGRPKILSTHKRKDGSTWDSTYGANVWWALDDDVMWSFVHEEDEGITDGSHLRHLLKTMQDPDIPSQVRG